MASDNPPPSGSQKNGNGNNNNARRAWGRWHWRIGIVAAIFVLILSLTGLLLHHAPALRLAERTVSWGWLLDWYGFEPKTVVSFPAREHWVTWIDGGLYLDGRPAGKHVEKPVGAGVTEGAIAVLSPHSVTLLTPEGLLIERLGSDALPGRIAAAGFDENDDLVLLTEAGAFRPIGGFLGWEPVEEPLTRSQPNDPPETVLEAALAAYRGEGISAERLILDVHTGAILGSWGPYVMDAAAIILILVTGTGIVIWFKKRRR
jgi:hypothetical protein